MIRLEKIRKVYKDGKRELEVLKGIDLEIKKNDITAVIGPSGAGKSTLLHVMGGIDMPTSGKVVFDGMDVYGLDERRRADIRNQNIGFVFQFYHLLPEFNAVENVMLPGLIKVKSQKAKVKSVKERARELLIEVGLGERLTHRPSELSGGEQQRVAIARALMNKPDVLLCDEPTGNLDSKMGEEVLRILFELNTTIVIVTHDKEIAKRAHRIVEIRDGIIV